VGAGLDSPCPVRNRKLASRVVNAGVIFSEVPPYISAAPWRFPVRNRILAALADLVVVVESAGAGGSMHTVKEALARDVPIMSVPGPIDSRASEGTNRLLSDGAEPCLGVEDILMALGLTASSQDSKSSSAVSVEQGSRSQPACDSPQNLRESRPAPDEAGQRALNVIGWRPVSVEHLGQRSGLNFRELASTLSWLEASGWIQRTGGWIERRAQHDPSARG
ncbi:MAG: DNA-processing protein DprA, partial [Microthrixaceae bacterium]